MKVEDGGELSRQDLRIPADDPDDEPLRPRQPDRRPHPFRPGLETVVEGPDEAKKIQGFSQAGRLEVDPDRLRLPHATASIEHGILV
jgi:hypothetical protein